MQIIQPSNLLKYRILNSKTKKEKVKIALVKHGHIAILNYKLGDNPKFEKALSVWRRTHYKFEMLGGLYLPQYKELRIPRGFNIYALTARYFPDYKFQVYNEFTPYDRVDINLKVSPITDIQIVAISHMISAPPYENNRKYTQQLITMDTGEGKSYSTIAAICFNKCRSVITAPTVRIADQWKDYFLQYTDIPPSKIMIVSGKSACDLIASGKSDAYVYIFVNKTLSDYLTSSGHLKTEKLLYNTKAKIKVMDEVHRNMKLGFQLDALSNFRMNYYLTATAGRADADEDKIFTKCFHDVIKNDGLKTVQESHINVIVKKYHYKIDGQVRRAIINPKLGLNSNLYENALFSYGRDYLFESLDFILNWIDKNNTKDGKLLILTATINGIEEIQKHLIKRYGTKKSIGIYHSKLSNKEREGFTDNDIILATDKGAGYGVDIPGTQFMINLVTYSNKNGAKQFKGRLRKMKDREVYYFELVNWSFDKTYSQYLARRPFLKANAKDTRIIELD